MVIQKLKTFIYIPHTLYTVLKWNTCHVQVQNRGECVEVSRRSCLQTGRPVIKSVPACHNIDCWLLVAAAPLTKPSTNLHLSEVYELLLKATSHLYYPLPLFAGSFPPHVAWARAETLNTLCCYSSLIFTSLTSCCFGFLLSQLLAERKWRTNVFI